MRLKAISFLLAVSIIASLTPFASAWEESAAGKMQWPVQAGIPVQRAGSDDMTVHTKAIDISREDAAEGLNQLGLFQGTANGFELERIPTRQEMAVMQIRLIGLEELAITDPVSHPFTDVDSWASPYVGAAYFLGLINGTSETTFGGNEPTTAPQYISLVLRTLGYSDQDGDFTWNESWRLADMIGLTAGQYGADSGFNRGDMAYISFNALGTFIKDRQYVLFQMLKMQGFIDFSAQMPHVGWQPRIGVTPGELRIKKGSTATVMVTFEDSDSKPFVYYVPGCVSVDHDNGQWTSEIDVTLKITAEEVGSREVFFYYSSGSNSKYSLGKVLVTVY